MIALLNVSAFYGRLNSLMYYANGKKYTGAAKNIGELNKEFDKYDRIYVYNPEGKEFIDNLTRVGFKLFTDNPFWVITKDSTNIQKAINSFDLKEYFNSSWRFQFDLENHIKEGTLTDLFILETLGAPNDKSKYFDGIITIENWQYSRFGVTLTLKNGIVVSYIKIE